MSKTVFAFGRMNPPTIGHEKLADKVASEAKRRGAMPHIYLSHTQNAKKDPLPYSVKIAVAKKAFGKVVTRSSAKTIIQVMQELEKMGHKEVVLIAGSDRVPEFKTFLAKYNGKDYNFDKIEVVSAGERDPDAEGVAGMSASKLRGIAQAGDYDTFAKGMPSKLRDADKKKVYNTIRSAMEDINEAPRIARKKGQPAGSDKHSDLYTDENPKGTIHGLKFATEKDAEASVAKIKSSDKKHAHKIQAAIAMEQRARVAGKTAAAGVYRAYINDMKKKTKEMNEEVTTKQISDLEKFGDRLLDKFGIDIEFSKHFADRMNDDRNKPEIKVAEIQALFKKIARKKAINIKKHKDSEVVLKDIQKDLNLPVAIKSSGDGDLEVVHKTIMRKKNFKTPNPVVQYEDYDPTDEELDDILTEIEEDDTFWEWDEDDDFEVELDEAPLTMQQRMKRRLLMKRLAPRIARKRALKMKKRANKDQLIKRSRRAALLLVKKKVAGDKGKDYKQLSPSEKIGIDRLVQKRLPMVGKIAKRLLPKMTKKETERMRNRSKTNESFELFTEQKVAQDPDVDERPGTQPKKYFSGVRKKSKEARAKHFERGAKMDDDNPAAYKKAPGDAGAKTKPSKHTKKFKQMFGEQKMECPPATKDVALNTKNRNATRENHMYGPLNVKEPGDYWEKIADKWDTSVEAAKKSVCGNCVAFDISPRMEECLPGPVSDGDGKLGYCWMHHFKCHSARACDTWATGGPIEEDDKSYAWQEKAFGKKEEVEYLEEKQIDALKKKSEKTGIPYGILKQVYNRGMAAWRTGHRPGTTPQQWAFARVNSFATKSKGTWGGADKDLAAKARGSSKKESVTEADPCWDGYKQVGMKKGASGKMVPNCVPEEVELDEKKQEFETDKDLPNLRRPKGMTDYQLKKFLMKTKSRQKDHFKGEDNIKEREMTDGEKEKLDRLKKKYEKSDMQKSMKDRYGDDGPFYATLTKMAMKKEAVSPAQQAAIAIAKKKSGKYDDDGKKIDEQDAAADAKERHNDEKERLKRKHDRELDTARLQDTRSKNANEAFEALIEQPCCDDCAEDEYGWVEETDFIAIDEAAAEYQGRKVKLNNPTRSDNPKKKTMVYVKNEKGNVVKVYFGDPNMQIKRDDPARRKSFRARHNCDNPGPKWKARYWSCKFWSKKPVSKLMKG